MLRLAPASARVGAREPDLRVEQDDGPVDHVALKDGACALAGESSGDAASPHCAGEVRGGQLTGQPTGQPSGQRGRVMSASWALRRRLRRSRRVSCRAARRAPKRAAGAGAGATAAAAQREDALSTDDDELSDALRHFGCFVEMPQPRLRRARDLTPPPAEIVYTNRLPESQFTPPTTRYAKMLSWFVWLADVLFLFNLIPGDPFRKLFKEPIVL